MSRQPIFKVPFALQNDPDASLAFAGLEAAPCISEYRTAKFDLCLYLRETHERLMGGFEYATDLFEVSTIERLLARVAEASDQKGRGPVPDKAGEREQVLETWNATGAPYPREVACTSCSPSRRRARRTRWR